MALEETEAQSFDEPLFDSQSAQKKQVQKNWLKLRQILLHRLVKTFFPNMVALELVVWCWKPTIKPSNPVLHNIIIV